MQAYFEWLPIRHHPDYKIYRDFQFGNLVHLLMLDTRLVGRSEQMSNEEFEAAYDPDRTLLGPGQLEWLDQRLETNGALWTVFGNQVILSNMIMGMNPDWRYNMDQWDGYPAERDRFISLWEKHDVENVVVVTGDTHRSYVFDIVTDHFESPYDPATGEGALAAEFVVPSISAGNNDAYQPIGEVTAKERILTDSQYNPHLHWADLKNHGYITVEFDREKAEVEYNYVYRLDERDPAGFVARRWYVEAGDPGVKR